MSSERAPHHPGTGLSSSPPPRCGRPAGARVAGRNIPEPCARGHVVVIVAPAKLEYRSQTPDGAARETLCLPNARYTRRRTCRSPPAPRKSKSEGGVAGGGRGQRARRRRAQSCSTLRSQRGVQAVRARSTAAAAPHECGSYAPGSATATRRLHRIAREAVSLAPPLRDDHCRSPRANQHMRSCRDRLPYAGA